MKHLLAIAAAGEAATGLVLLAYPPAVGWLLFGADIAGAGAVIARITGISLIGLGLACWPGRVGGGPLRGMLTHSALATLYLAYLGLGDEWVGQLLWPAVVIHAVMTILLARAWLNRREVPGHLAARE